MLNCSLRSPCGSRWEPPSSSHLVKRHLKNSSQPSPRPFHHLLLQIGGTRSAVLNCSLRSPCGSRWEPPSSSHLVKRHLIHSSQPSPRPCHHLLLQIGGTRSAGLNCSLRSPCGSRWEPPSSSHLVKRHLKNSSQPSPRPFHHLLLQIGGTRSAGLNCRLSRSARSHWVRFAAQPRRRTPARANESAFAITSAKMYRRGFPC